MHRVLLTLLARALVSNVTLESDGVYWAVTSIGTPAEQFSVILDTGSSALAVPCVGCTNCGKTHKRWNATESLTSVPTPRRSVARYAEGTSLNLTAYEDTVCIDTACVTNYPVYCIDAESPVFKVQQADGIMGLNKDFVYSVGSFSMCYQDKKMSIGMPYDGRGYAWYPKMSPSIFGIELKSIGGVLLTRRGVTAVIDSGTTFNLVPRRFRDKLSMSGMCEVEFHGGPRITFDPCIPITEIEDGKDENLFIFGASFMRRIPRVVFTQTHVGLSLGPAECVDSRASHEISPWSWIAFINVIIAYLLCIYYMNLR